MIASSHYYLCKFGQWALLCVLRVAYALRYSVFCRNESRISFFHTFGGQTPADRLEFELFYVTTGSHEEQGWEVI